MKYSASQTKSLPNNEQLASGWNFTVFIEIQRVAYQRTISLLEKKAPFMLMYLYANTSSADSGASLWLWARVYIIRPCLKKDWRKLERDWRRLGGKEKGRPSEDRRDEGWGDGEGREGGRKQILSTEVWDFPASFDFMSSFFTRSSNFKCSTLRFYYTVCIAIHIGIRTGACALFCSFSLFICCDDSWCIVAQTCGNGT